MIHKCEMFQRRENFWRKQKVTIMMFDLKRILSFLAKSKKSCRSSIDNLLNFYSNLGLFIFIIIWCSKEPDGLCDLIRTHKDIINGNGKKQILCLKATAMHHMAITGYHSNGVVWPRCMKHQDECSIKMT